MRVVIAEDGTAGCVLAARLTEDAGRGRVTIQGPDPQLQPVLRMGWLESDGDRDVAVAAGREVMALTRTAPLADIVHSWPNQDDPDQPLRTVETFHPVGTCRMGRPRDPEAAVDATGGVLGLQGLSVIDASVIPRIASANTHLRVIALAGCLAAQRRAAR